MAKPSDWERSDFPIVCETCLGDNPFVRMMKASFDKECKICSRPFTVYRWRAGTKGRYKKTEVCQGCAKLKNVCQTCLLDLTYGLPVQVRDAAMPQGTFGAPARIGANQEYMNRINDQRLATGGVDFDLAQLNPVIEKVARKTPRYDRNKAQVCSFFIKGTCNRGDQCPYRHELPDPNQPEDLAHQNLQDRYFGKNDPVAKRLLAQISKSIAPPPADLDIKTLFISNVDAKITDADLRGHFYSFGEISSIKLLPAQSCAFIEFTARDAAEAAIAKYQKLIVKGSLLRVGWAKPASKNAPGASPAPISSSVPYPSMDPERLGASVPRAVAASPAEAAALPKPSFDAGEAIEPPTKRQKVQ